MNIFESALLRTTNLVKTFVPGFFHSSEEACVPFKRVLVLGEWLSFYTYLTMTTMHVVSWDIPWYLCKTSANKTFDQNNSRIVNVEYNSGNKEIADID